MRFFTGPPKQPHPCQVAVIETDWGYAAIATNQQRLIRLFLPQKSSSKLHRSINDLFPDHERNDQAGCNFQKQIQNYFSDIQEKLKGEVDISWATEFQQAVLKACCKIAPGKTITYGQLAQQAGHPQAARAVGAVMAKNPIPLLIPCHRVVGSNGAMTGYSGTGGIAMKQRLLKHEQAWASSH